MPGEIGRQTASISKNRFRINFGDRRLTAESPNHTVAEFEFTSRAFEILQERLVCGANCGYDLVEKRVIHFGHNPTVPRTVMMFVLMCHKPLSSPLTDYGESFYIHEEGVGLGSAQVTRIVCEWPVPFRKSANDEN